MTLPITDPTSPAVRRSAEGLCKYLRAKMVHAAHGDRVGLASLEDSPTTVYWCLLTMRSAGPDDGLVHAERCGPGRVCNTSDDEPVA
jgi:hypothetical protein